MAREIWHFFNFNFVLVDKKDLKNYRLYLGKIDRNLEEIMDGLENWTFYNQGVLETSIMQ